MQLFHRTAQPMLKAFVYLCCNLHLTQQWHLHVTVLSNTYTVKGLPLAQSLLQTLHH